MLRFNVSTKGIELRDGRFCRFRTSRLIDRDNSSSKRWVGIAEVAQEGLEGQTGRDDTGVAADPYVSFVFPHVRGEEDREERTIRRGNLQFPGGGR